MASSATTLLFHHGSTRLIPRRRCQSPLLRTCIPKPFLSLRSSRGSSSTAPLVLSPKAKSVGLPRAYVTGAPPIVGEEDPKIDDGSKSEAEKEEESKDLIKWGLVWSLMSKHKLRLLVCLLTLVGCSTCTLSMPVFSGRFFEVLIGVRPDPLWQLLSKIAVLYSLEPVFTIVFVTNMNAIWESVMATLRAQIFRRVLIQKAEFFDKYKVGELTGLLTSDLGALNSIVNDNISRDRGFRAFSEVFGTICILFTLSPQLAPVLGLLMLAVSVLVAVYKRSTVPVYKAHGLAQATMSDCVSETFSAIRTVRSFSGEKRQMSLFGSQILSYQRSGLKLGTFKSINESITRVAVYISLLALYALGGSKVKTGELAVGTVVSFIGYTFTLTFAVQGLVNTFGDLRGSFAAIERINSILNAVDIDEALAYGLERDIHTKKVQDENLRLFLSSGPNLNIRHLDKYYMSDLKSTNNLRTLTWAGDVCLDDLDFAYPLRPDVKVLDGFSLTLKAGTVTALVGSSGAGKSTIVQLLARFYEPTQGRITVAGEDVRMFDKSEWAKVISIVNQEPVLFSLSVAENIAYGLPNDHVSKDDIVKAAKAANAHEFIISLPQGYDTLVGERGGLLSGGQRQRVAIARALLKNAPILILDEATSALDAVSERLVQSALNRLMKDRTTLVIAHRLSTVQSAHQIAVCSSGKIIELGTHSELVAQKGSYASLVGTQRLAFE
ncbi:ABC transporter B family member 28 [Raphanus sativus]|uniref:ABC transporter B family member 28 n=1 Tax=Raphanus sativus TaxID=3726 RepID=A0A6J0KW64_RAPSA|nr:ABC transporter B family member 28 [Raphanus sativus]XP_056852457.1 ABC transporter B family member 28 [Raphanus sativus]KAJ4872811.1 ABC transporter B family member 28 [Raphanus sativus]